MSWLLLNPLRTLPPIGLVAVGAVVGAAGVPVVKKVARNLAVTAVRGILTVSDAVKETGESLTRSWEQMAQEARKQQAEMEQSMHTGKTTESVFDMVEPKDDIQDLTNNMATQTKKTKSAISKEHPNKNQT
ncbi:MAG: hypothetical protein ACOY35_01500 [Bacillota bacterium]